MKISSPNDINELEGVKV